MSSGNSRSFHKAPPTTPKHRNILRLSPLRSSHRSHPTNSDIHTDSSNINAYNNNNNNISFISSSDAIQILNSNNATGGSESEIDTSIANITSSSSVESSSFEDAYDSFDDSSRPKLKSHKSRSLAKFNSAPSSLTSTKPKYKKLSSNGARDSLIYSISRYPLLVIPILFFYRFELFMFFFFFFFFFLSCSLYSPFWLT